MAVTVKDVAKLAGVSPATVSRVCNNAPSISEETRQRVQNAIAELGYELPAASGKQAAPAIKKIAMILPPPNPEAYDSPFLLKAIRGISDVCNQRGAVCLTVTGRDYEDILRSVQLFQERHGIDGYILLYSKKEDIVLRYLQEQGLLHVIVGKALEPTPQTICIDNDNLLAGREATDYLYSLGHRRIGYVGNPNDFLYANDRRAGYQLSLLLHDLPERSEDCVAIDRVDASGNEALYNLLKREDRPTAFVVSDDMLALALEHACAQLQLFVPEDVSIIAFNNTLYAELAFPQITAVDINSYQLGHEAASHILNHLENPDLMTTKIVVPHRIVERESCKKI